MEKMLDDFDNEYLIKKSMEKLDNEKTITVDGIEIDISFTNEEE